MKNLVIVESPAKAKTIQRYLGPDYRVIASYGHIRDLPSKSGSVDPDQKFSMVWDVSARSQKYIQAIVSDAKSADHIYLATDPDREGEAIAWHIMQVLGEKRGLKTKPISRIVFNEITKKAVQHAMAHPRTVNQELVDAYLARRALDYLVGFNISPVLWRKLPGSRSAGRVQSVALRLIVNREEEIEAFQSREYWSIKGDFKTPQNDTFEARLTHLSGEKLDKFALTHEAAATQAVTLLKSATYHVACIEKKKSRRHPTAPFITSTLQQEAARKLGFSASRTMQTAQKLYEGIMLGGESTGLITYMRTDGVQLSQDAVEGMRTFIQKNYGEDYLPKAPVIYKSKAKNAQEAHEAIRPTDITRTPDDVKPYLDEAQLKLYTLIWKRTLACQMTPALFDQVVVTLSSDAYDAQGIGYHQFRANGSILTFDGFLRVYQEGVDQKAAQDKDDDDTSQGSERDRLLPVMHEQDITPLHDLKPAQHFTEPPPRYSEASLVKKLEELGIGRPSTYASIIKVLQDRDYVHIVKRQFIPNDRGRIVTSFLQNYFSKYVEYDFTAHLEEELDQISAGDLAWLKVMDQFWQAFHANVQDAMKLEITHVIDQVQNDLVTFLFGADKNRTCPTCKEGELNLKLGKFGAFLGCSRYPQCPHTQPLTHDSTPVDGEGEGGAPASVISRSLGHDPHTHSEVMLRKGAYGWYIQWDGEFEAVNEPLKTTAKTKKTKKTPEPKPKRVGLPATVDIKNFTLEDALSYKSLPILLGQDPESGENVFVKIGRFGPYVQCGKVMASIPKAMQPFHTLTLDQARELIVKKIAQHEKKQAKMA